MQLLFAHWPKRAHHCCAVWRITLLPKRLRLFAGAFGLAFCLGLAEPAPLWAKPLSDKQIQELRQSLNKTSDFDGSAKLYLLLIQNATDRKDPALEVSARLELEKFLAQSTGVGQRLRYANLLALAKVQWQAGQAEAAKNSLKNLLEVLPKNEAQYRFVTLQFLAALAAKEKDYPAQERYLGQYVLSYAPGAEFYSSAGGFPKLLELAQLTHSGKEQEYFSLWYQVAASRGNLEDKKRVLVEWTNFAANNRYQPEPFEKLAELYQTEKAWGPLRELLVLQSEKEPAPAQKLVLYGKLLELDREEKKPSDLAVLTRILRLSEEAKDEAKTQEILWLLGERTDYPSRFQALERLGALTLKAQDWLGALKVHRRLLAEPKRPVEDQVRWLDNLIAIAQKLGNQDLETEFLSQKALGPGALPDKIAALEALNGLRQKQGTVEQGWNDFNLFVAQDFTKAPYEGEERVLVLGAKSAEAKGDPKTAYKLYSQAFEKLKNKKDFDPKVGLGLGRKLAELARLHLGDAELAKCLERNLGLYRSLQDQPGAAKTELVWAQTLERLKQGPEATKHYKAALELYQTLGDKVRVNELLTLLANAEGGSDEQRLAGLEKLEAAQAASGDNQALAATRLELGQHHYRQGRLEPAVKAYLSALAVNAPAPKPRLQAASYAGSTLAKMGRAEEAEKAYRTGLELLPKPPKDPEVLELGAELYEGKAKVQSGLGQPDRALEAIEAALGLAPNSFSAQNTKGAILLKAGKAKEAIAFLGKQAEQAKGPETVRLWLLLAKAQLSAGLTQPGLESLEKVLSPAKAELDEVSAEAMGLKSYGLNLMGKKKEAVANQEALVARLETAGLDALLVAALVQQADLQRGVGQLVSARAAALKAEQKATPGSEPWASALLLEGQIALKQGKTEEALKLFGQLETTLKAHPAPAILAQMYYQRGFAQMEKSALQKALEDFTQAQTLFAQIGKSAEAQQSRLAQANGRIQLGLYPEAAQGLEQSLKEAAPEDLVRGDALNAQAFLFSEQGLYKEALESSKKAEQFYQAQGQMARLPEVLNARGLLYLKTKNYEQAEVTLTQALNAAKENPILTAEVANNLGGLYRSLGNLQKAREQLEKAAQVQQQLGLESQLALTYNNLGSIALEAEDYPKALDYLGRARQFAQKFQLKKELALSWSNEGTLQFRQKHLPEAKKAFQEAILLQRELRLNLDLALSLNNQSFIASEEGHLEEALGLIQEAVGALSFKPLDPKAYFPTPQAGSVLAPDLMTGFLLNKGTFLRQLAKGQDKGKAKQMQQAALSSFALAIELVESLRAGIKGEESQQMLMQTNADTYQQIVGLLYDLGEQDPGGGYFEQAFSYAEASRARSFLDRLAEQAAKASLSLPPALRESEARLTGKIEEVNQSIFVELSKPVEHRDGKKIETWQLERVGLQLELKKLAQEIEAKFPAFASLKYPSILDVEGVRNRLLDSDSILIAYLVGEDRSFGWVIGKKIVKMVVLPPAADLDAMIRSYRETLVNPLVDEGQEGQDELVSDLTQIHLATGLKIYRNVIGPLVEPAGAAKKLLIVPDGVLYYLPFETALVTIHPASNQKFVKGREYLLYRYAISYSPSASVLSTIKVQLASRDKAASQARRKFVGFGDPEFAPKPEEAKNFKYDPTLQAQNFYELSRLFATKKELKQISALFENSADVFVREEAKESKAKSSLAGHQYIHFATHGILDENHPEYSGVVLNLVQPDPPENGFLQTSEIFDLKLDADLVVLSACETGLGKVIKGEGMVGLNRAFLFAGTPANVVSLWTVADDSTSKLMIYFYGFLNQGLEKAEALRQAKLKLLFELDGDQYLYPDPFFWGPFVLNGI